MYVCTYVYVRDPACRPSSHPPVRPPATCQTFSHLFAFFLSHSLCLSSSKTPFVGVDGGGEEEGPRGTGGE